MLQTEQCKAVHAELLHAELLGFTTVTMQTKTSEFLMTSSCNFRINVSFYIQDQRSYVCFTWISHQSHQLTEWEFNSRSQTLRQKVDSSDTAQIQLFKSALVLLIEKLSNKNFQKMRHVFRCFIYNTNKRTYLVCLHINRCTVHACLLEHVQYFY